MASSTSFPFLPDTVGTNAWDQSRSLLNASLTTWAIKQGFERSGLGTIFPCVLLFHVSQKSWLVALWQKSLVGGGGGTFASPAKLSLCQHLIGGLSVWKWWDRVWGRQNNACYAKDSRQRCDQRLFSLCNAGPSPRWGTDETQRQALCCPMRSNNTPVFSVSLIIGII